MDEHLSVLAGALTRYQEKTGIDLRTLPNLQVPSSGGEGTVNAVLATLKESAAALNDAREGGRWPRIRETLKPVVRVALLFSDVAAEGTMSYMPGGKAVIVAISVLLKTTQEVEARLDVLEQLFNKLAYFLHRLNVRRRVPLTPEAREIVIKILVELLDVLALATRTMKRGHIKLFFNALLKENEAQRALNNLEDLTMQELQLTAVENLTVSHQILHDLSGFRQALHNSTGANVQQQFSNMCIAVDTIATNMSGLTMHDLVAELREGLRPLRQILNTGTNVPPPAQLEDTATRERVERALADVVAAAVGGDLLARVICAALFIAARFEHLVTLVLLLFSLGCAIVLNRQAGPTRLLRDPLSVTVIDLLGDAFLLPLWQCRTPYSLHNALLVWFEERKGRSFVRSQSYEVAHAGVPITLVSWEDIVVAGVEIMMHAVTHGSRINCPACHAPGYFQLGCWVTCSRCEKVLQVSNQTPWDGFGSGSSNATVQQTPSLQNALDSLSTPVPDTSHSSPVPSLDNGETLESDIETELDELRFCRRIRIILEEISGNSRALSPAFEEDDPLPVTQPDSPTHPTATMAPFPVYEDEPLPVTYRYPPASLPASMASRISLASHPVSEGGEYGIRSPTFHGVTDRRSAFVLNHRWPSNVESVARSSVSYSTRAQERATPLRVHSLFAYKRWHPAPISFDVAFTPSARSVLDKSTHAPVPAFTLAQPATEPPIPANSRFVCRSDKFPWLIVVGPVGSTSTFYLGSGRNQRTQSSAALTNLDLLYAVHTTLMTRVTPDEWTALDSKAQCKVAAAYDKRCTRMGGGWEGGVRRIDWLHSKTHLIGIEMDKSAQAGKVCKLIFGRG